MLITYLDTSALIKRYIDEQGSQILRDWWRSIDIFGTSQITYAEMASALSKASRIGWITKEEAILSWQIFLEDWQSLAVVEIKSVLVELAGQLAWSDGLRGYDAIHLAALLEWQNALGLEITLATFDQQLKKAAQNHQINTFPNISFTS